MPVFKLYYFNARGRAEPARLCFAVAGVEYEDVRYTLEEWAPKKKEGLSPMGYLPMLEVDGKKLCESLAIMRYIAREYGLCPSDSFEIGQCDMIVDSLNDVYAKIFAFFFEKDEDKKKGLKEEFFATHLPSYLTKLTALLKSNSGGNGFFVGNKLSYADLSILCFGDTLDTVAGDTAYDKYPEMKAHYAHISEIPAIKKWLKDRPDTQI